MHYLKKLEELRALYSQCLNKRALQIFELTLTDIYAVAPTP